MSKIVAISGDPRVFEEARKILKEELNMTLSKYVEIQLRALVRSVNQPFKSVFEGVAVDMFEGVKKSKNVKKSKKKK